MKEKVKNLEEKKGEEKVKQKRGLTQIITTIMLVLLSLVALAVIGKFSLDYFHKNAEISSAHAQLIQETIKMKRVVIDPSDPSKIEITFCCAEGEITSANQEKEEEENKKFDIGLVIDRSDSMTQAGWTMDIDENLLPLAEFENVEILEEAYSVPNSFTIPVGTERLAVLIEWQEIEGYYGSKGSEILTNLEKPDNKKIFGQVKPNNANFVDPPYDVGDVNEFFSGMSTLPQITYIETPDEGEWDAFVYGWQFTPTNNPPSSQYVNITVYIGTAQELMMNSPVIALDAAKDSAKIFVNNLREMDRISITTFAKFSELLSTLTDEKSTLLNKIDLITKQPETTINAGIQISKEDFIANSRTDAEKVMVILTDGQNDAGPDIVIQEAQLAKNEGIKIYTVGLSGFVDEDMLKTVASDPSYYYFAPDASILSSIFDSIRERILQESISISLSDGFKIVFYNETHSYSPESTDIDLKPLETKTYSFDLENHLTNVQRIETYPLKIVNFKTIIGPLIQTYTF